MAKDLVKWLDGLLGPVKLQGDGVDRTTPRGGLNFVGAQLVDSPDEDRTDIIFTGIISGGADSVVLAEAAVAGDWVCSANDAVVAKVLRATAANLANGGKVLGPITAPGSPGDTVQVAKTGAVVAAATLGLSSSTTADTLTLDTVTARCVRNTTPAPTAIVVGRCDKLGNGTVDPVHPGIGTWIDNLSHVSLLDYGADPTGVASSSTALTNAHADAVATGKKLLIPAGSYKLTSNFTITAECEAIGQFTGTATLTISGPFRAARKQVFASSLGVTFSDYTENAEAIKPEWFGAKGDGQAFTGSVTTGTGAVSASAATFSAASVGKRLAIFTVGTALAFASTVSAYTDTTHVTTSGTAGSTFTSKSGIIGTDDQAALARAWAATRGLRWVELATGKIYCVASSLPLSTGVGRGWRVRGHGTIQAVAAFSGGVLSNDPGTNTSASVTDVFIDGLTVIGSNLAQDGLFLANWAYPNKAAGFTGRVSDLSVQSCLRFGVYAHPCQESTWHNVRTTYTGDRGLTLIACNGASLHNVIVASVYGTAKDGVLIDAWPNQGSLAASTFTADAATDVVTAVNSYPNEMAARFSTTGTLPAGLSAGVDYWLIRTGTPGSSKTSRVATSRDNAQAGVYVDITTAGTGTHTITPQNVSGANSYGGGDVFIHGFIVETVTGRAVVIRDENGVSGTVAKLSGGHIEGCGLDAILIDRQGVVVDGVAASGPGAGAYYPVHLTANAHGSRVRGVLAGSFTSVATLVDAGCQNPDVAPTFSVTTKTWIDPIYSGGWASKIQQKRASGDQSWAGQLGIGTLSPRERLDVALGGANIGRGSLVLDHGQLRTPWGGSGQGQNLLKNSRAYDQSSWTVGKGTSCTMTNNAALAPDGTMTAALQACWGSTPTQRFQWAEADIYTYLGFVDINNGDTTNGVNYVGSVFLQAPGTDESGNAFVADASGGSATVLLDTTLGTGVATGDGKPFGFVSMGLAAGDPVFNATEKVVAWVVSVDSEQQLTLTPFGVNINTGAMTAVTSWNGDTYVPPMRCQLLLGNGNGTSIASKNIVVDWAWRSYDLGGNTVAYPGDATKKPRWGVYWHSTGQYPYAVNRWEDGTEIVAKGAPLRPGPVTHTEALPVATKRPGAALNAHPTTNPAYGQQVFWLKLAISNATADGATLFTVPTDVRGLYIHRVFWETGTAWTGGAASAIGVSSDDANYNTKGDLLGGAGGDVAATLTASKFTGGTVGAKFGANGIVVLAAGKILRFDRITSAFTAGTGFVWVECSILI